VQSELNDLLQKQMDRKDFFKHVAIGFVALMGVSAVIKTLSSHQLSKIAGGGFGGSAYGGGKLKRI
jgi:hypothetical protein